MKKAPRSHELGGRTISHGVAEGGEGGGEDSEEAEAEGGSKWPYR